MDSSMGFHNSKFERHGSAGTASSRVDLNVALEPGAVDARVPQSSKSHHGPRLTAAAGHWPLVFILVVAAGLRFHGLNWDDGHHLHPDERFIAIVADKIRLPASIGAYFDTARSPLNPY